MQETFKEFFNSQKEQLTEAIKVDEGISQEMQDFIKTKVIDTLDDLFITKNVMIKEISKMREDVFVIKFQSKKLDCVKFFNNYEKLKKVIDVQELFYENNTYFLEFKY